MRGLLVILMGMMLSTYIGELFPSPLMFTPIVFGLEIFLLARDVNRRDDKSELAEDSIRLNVSLHLST